MTYSWNVSNPEFDWKVPVVFSAKKSGIPYSFVIAPEIPGEYTEIFTEQTFLDFLGDVREAFIANGFTVTSVSQEATGTRDLTSS